MRISEPTPLRWPPANIISGNTSPAGWGLFIGTVNQAAVETVFPQSNTIQRNYIGLAIDQQGTAPNTKGIVLIRASRNTIGGTTDALAKLCCGQYPRGILLSDGAGENVFLKTYVGVVPPGMGPSSRQTSPNIAYGNGSHGILLENGAQRNTLGGITTASGVVISGNGGNGINIAATAGSGNRLGANSIYGNTGVGIDLGGNGLTVNDPADADTGPNNLQNYPTTTFSISGGNLIASYQVDSAPANSVYGSGGIKVDFYEADSTGQGSTLLGTDQYLVSDYNNGLPGTRVKNLGNAVALGIVAGDKLTATATDADGNSSEFSPPVNAPGGAPGFEGDVAPRPDGDGNMTATDVTQLRRFVSGIDTPNPATNELQRIDSAPRASSGDGVVNATDVVQGRRYVAGLDPQTAAGGPASRGSMPGSIFVPEREPGLGLFTRELRIGRSAQSNGKVTVPVEMISNGNEVAMSFTIEYDETTLANPRVSLAGFAPKGSTLTVNTSEPGRIGILIDATGSMTASARTRNVLTVTFDVIADGSTMLNLTDSLAAIGISDADGNSLAAKYFDCNLVMQRK